MFDNDKIINSATTITIYIQENKNRNTIMDHCAMISVPCSNLLPFDIDRGEESSQASKDIAIML